MRLAIGFRRSGGDSEWQLDEGGCLHFSGDETVSAELRAEVRAKAAIKTYED